MESSDHLFRREAGRMIAALTRVFGIHNLALAEDAVQDTFCRALEVWKFRGAPANPSAWLMATAKNRAIDILRRGQRTPAPAPGPCQQRDSRLSRTTPISKWIRAYETREDLHRLTFT